MIVIANSKIGVPTVPCAIFLERMRIAYLYIQPDGENIYTYYIVHTYIYLINIVEKSGVIHSLVVYTNTYKKIFFKINLKFILLSIL